MDFLFRETNALLQQTVQLLEEVIREAMLLPDPLRCMLGSTAGQYGPCQILLLTHKAKNANMDTHTRENACKPAHIHSQTQIKLV